jgi:hypothetical protein
MRRAPCVSLSTTNDPRGRHLCHHAPETIGEQKKKCNSSRYIGDSWIKAHSPGSCYASEEGAARAYDCAAVQAHGPGAERNFPDLPVCLRARSGSSAPDLGVWQSL